MSNRKFKIGLIQIQSEQGNTAKNLERGIEMIRQAAAQGAKIVCLPELYYGGYHLSSEEMQKIAETKNGPFVQTLASVAKELNVYIIAGYAEADQEIRGRIYNAAIFINDKGETIGNMRKVYAWGPEKLKFRCGDEFPVYDTPLGKIGLMICYDVEFPEPARIMALKGAELVFVPAVWSIPAQRRWEVDLAGNALFNLMYFAGSNPVGDGACGQSQVVGPDGVVRALASETEEEILICEVDLNENVRVRSQIPYLNDFREDTFSMDAVATY